MDLSLLPDRGKKVIDLIKQQELKLAELKDNLAKLNNKSCSKNRVLTPSSKLNFSNLSFRDTPNRKSSVNSSNENKENVKIGTKKRYISVSSSDESKRDFHVQESKIKQSMSDASLSDEYQDTIDTRKKFNKPDLNSKVSLISSDEDEDVHKKKNLVPRNIVKKASISVSSDDEYQEKIQTNKNFNRDEFEIKHSTKFNDQKFSNHFDNFNVHDIPIVPKTSFAVDDLGKKALETLNRQQSLTHKKLEQLHGSLTSRPTEDQKANDPYGLKIQLMGHQKHALAWMMWREKQKPRGGILGK